MIKLIIIAKFVRIKKLNFMDNLLFLYHISCNISVKFRLSLCTAAHLSLTSTYHMKFNANVVAERLVTKDSRFPFCLIVIVMKVRLRKSWA